MHTQPILTIGQYRSLRVTGTGPRGVVYEAIQIETRQRCAIKHWQRLDLTSAEFRRRRNQFMIEVHTLQSLSHPNIICPAELLWRDDDPFLIRELIEGRSLESILTLEGPLSLAEGIEAFFQLAEAVDRIHELGISHDHLTPANIIFDSSRRPFVVDVALLFGADSPPFTRHLDAIEYPFLAPERLVAGRRGAIEDLYSFAALFFSALSGYPPFAGETPEGLLAQCVRGKRVDLSQNGRSFPVALEATFERALALDPKRRYRSATSFVDAVFRAGGSTTQSPSRKRGVDAVPTGIDRLNQETSGARRGRSARNTENWRNGNDSEQAAKRRFAAIVIGSCAVVMTLVLGVWARAIVSQQSGRLAHSSRAVTGGAAYVVNVDFNGNSEVQGTAGLGTLSDQEILGILDAAAHNISALSDGTQPLLDIFLALKEAGSRPLASAAPFLGALFSHPSSHLRKVVVEAAGGILSAIPENSEAQTVVLLAMFDRNLAVRLVAAHYISRMNPKELPLAVRIRVMTEDNERVKAVLTSRAHQ